MGSETPMETTEQRNATLRSVQTLELTAERFRLEFASYVLEEGPDVKRFVVERLPEGGYKLTATVVRDVPAEDEPADDPVEAAQAEPPKEGPRGLGTKSFG